MDITDGVAHVAMADPATCQRCGACGRIGQRMVLDVHVESDNPVSVGDAVLVDIPVELSFANVALVYLLPLAGLLLGAVGGTLLTRVFWPHTAYPNLAAILLSLLGLAGGFFFAWWWDRRRQGDARSQIRIVQRL